MPELSRFLGIVIYMNYREHPPAHFHADYGEYEITVDIATGVVTGKFPRRAFECGPGMVFIAQGRIGGGLAAGEPEAADEAD